ncbi:MAG: PilX N-terminal domain-containing pilus assembly protein [Pseudomonadota bacterium]|nr:PilX N-terminal domain-containing pilus assembly protein [Pseudomonadota bacterium]
MTRQPALHANQGGIVLVTGLLILLVMTLIGVTALQTTTLEEKMAGNMQNRNMALQATEAALRNAEDWINSHVTEPPETSGGTNGVWILNAPDPDVSSTEPWWDEADESWWSANAAPYGGDPVNPTGAGTTLDANLAAQPRYLVEQQAFVPDSLVVDPYRTQNAGKVYYRVTGRGVGGSDTAVSRLQGTYTRRY